MTRDVAGEVAAMLEAGHKDRLDTYLQTLAPADRQALQPLAAEWLERVPLRRSDTRGRVMTRLEWNQRDAALALAVAACTWSDVARLGRDLWRHRQILAMLDRSPPTWLGQAVDVLLTEGPDLYPVVWGWVQAGHLPRPSSDAWLRAGFVADDDEAIARRFEADPRAEVDDFLRRLQLADANRYHAPTTGWIAGLRAAVDAGFADRHTVARAAIGALLGPAPAGEIKFLGELVLALVRDDDRFAHRAGLVAALAAPRPQARSVALDQLEALDRRHPLDSSVLPALGPCLVTPVKAVARKAQRLAERVAQRPGADSAHVAEAAAAAALSPVLEVRRAWGTAHLTPPQPTAPRPAEPPRIVGMLDDALRVPAIDSVDELVEQWSRAVERTPSGEALDRLLDGVVRLAPRRAQTRVLAGPLLQRCERAAQTVASDTVLRYALSCLLIRWLTDEPEPDPPPEMARWLPALGARHDPNRWLVELMFTPMDRFLALRLEAAWGAVARGHHLGCLGTASHRGCRLAPSVAVARVGAWEAAGAEPPEVEVVLMLSRLTTVGRAEARAEAAALRSPTGRALAYALGLDAPIDDLPVSVQIAAARCTGASVDALDRVAGVPDGARPAEVQFMPLSAAPHLRLELTAGATPLPDRRQVTPRFSPPEPLARDPDGALASAPVFITSQEGLTPRTRGRALLLAASLWTVGWMGWAPFAQPAQAADPAPFRLWASLRTQDLEPFFAVGAVRLAAHAAGENVSRGHAAFLEPLLDPYVPLGPCAVTALAVGLGSRPPEVRLLAVDVLRTCADDGRLSEAGVDALGARVASLWRTMSAPRFAANLLSAGAPCGREVLEAAIGHTEDPPRRWVEVLDAWEEMLGGAPADAGLLARMRTWKLSPAARQTIDRLTAGG